MKRREFIAGLGAAAVWPFAARAQARVPVIGILIVANPEPFSSLFRRGLAELGYVEGRSVQIEFRSADGKPERLPALAADLVARKVDAIVAVQTPSVQAAKEATTQIPIVMAPAADPLGTGLVASLARPGGNITGMSFVTSELMGKNLELLREIVPNARRVTFLGVAADPVTVTFVAQLRQGGDRLGMDIRPAILNGTEEFEAAFAQMDRESADAVVVQPSFPRKPVADLALRYRLPAISPNRGFPEAGGLLSYAGSLEDVYRRVPLYLDRILKGARPADLPVEQPTKFEMVVNAKTAQALRLTLPPTLLARADEVIE